jgi:hypothetical protein
MVRLRKANNNLRDRDRKLSPSPTTYATILEGRRLLIDEMRAGVEHMSLVGRPNDYGVAFDYTMKPAPSCYRCQGTFGFQELPESFTDEARAKADGGYNWDRNYAWDWQCAEAAAAVRCSNSDENCARSMGSSEDERE